MEANRTESPSIDGVYQYKWSTRFGRHTVFYEIKDGLIQDNPANSDSPIKRFAGKPIKEFMAARIAKGWRFSDDSLHQITQHKAQPEALCSNNT